MPLLSALRVGSSPASRLYRGPTLLWQAGAAGVSLFADEFSSLSLDPIGDRSGTWGTYFLGWNSRALGGNADEAIKAHDAYTGSGGSDLATVCGGPLHEDLGDGTVRLYGREIPPGDQAQFSGFRFAAGMLTAELSHYQRRFTAEVRMRVPQIGKGHHVALWLVYKNRAWPPEIDMVELVDDGGSGPRRLFMNHHPFADPDPKTYYAGTVPQEMTDPWTPAHVLLPDVASWKDWHTYRCVISDSVVEWWVDGVLRMSRPNTSYLTQPLYLMVSPEIGGNWAGDPDGTTPWPLQVDIDYARITGTPEPWAGESWAALGDGDPWPAARWALAEAGGTGAVDAQGGEGRLLAQGAAYTYSRIMADQAIQTDSDLLVRFRFSEAGEKYFAVGVRANGLWNPTNAQDPHTAYKIEARDTGAAGALQFRPVIGGVRGTAVEVAKSWGTGLWNLRVRLSDTTIQAKAWPDGDAEPGAWDIDETDSQVPSGTLSLGLINDAGGSPRSVLIESIAPLAPPWLLLGGVWDDGGAWSDGSTWED